MDWRAKLFRLITEKAYLAAAYGVVLNKAETEVDIPTDVSDESDVYRKYISYLKDSGEIQINQ